MSCLVASDCFPASGRYADGLPIVIKSRSCPTFGRKQVSKARAEPVRQTDSLISELANKLISSCKIEFKCADDGTTSYFGKIVRPEEVVKLVECTGLSVFQSYTYIHFDEHFPSGTTFLILTTYDPLPDGFR